MNVDRGKKDRGYKRVKQSRAIVNCVVSDVTFVSIVIARVCGRFRGFFASRNGIF